MIILEVKGGAFTYTPPAYDFGAFKNSVKNLIEKPAIQGQCLLDELNKQKILTIYNKEHKEISKLNISDYRNITVCCCTLDNLTIFSTKQNLLKDLGFKTPKYPTWTLSIDDLRIYADLLESPSQFTHFLEQRMKAIKSKLSIYDEIDHLALYFKYNCYTDKFKDVKAYRISIGSHKEEIDTYYHNKYAKNNKKFVKPHQKISKRIKEIIDILDKQNKIGYTKIAKCLLDLSLERENLEYLLEQALLKQKETFNLMPIHLPNEAATSLILYQDGIFYKNVENMQKQIYANMVISNAAECNCLKLNYDKNDILYNIDFEYLKLANLNKNEQHEVEEYTEWLRENRINIYKKKNCVNKINRNEQCPCGSGRKYKFCCAGKF